MAMDLKVSTSALTSEAAGLRNLKRQLEQEITAMRSVSARYLNMWDGGSKTAFVNSVNQNMNLLNAFVQNVENFAKALEDVAGMYERAEQDAIRRATEKN
ncbi:MAG: WXG100 family type VII secretion target [Oscillibacter sp.]|nr:WXG100 family type VII secretion target [Oscillibacter sp.]